MDHYSIKHALAILTGGHSSRTFSDLLNIHSLGMFNFACEISCIQNMYHWGLGFSLKIQVPADLDSGELKISYEKKYPQVCEGWKLSLTYCPEVHMHICTTHTKSKSANHWSTHSVPFLIQCIVGLRNSNRLYCWNN